MDAGAPLGTPKKGPLRNWLYSTVPAMSTPHDLRLSRGGNKGQSGNETEMTTHGELLEGSSIVAGDKRLGNIRRAREDHLSGNAHGKV